MKLLTNLLKQMVMRSVKQFQFKQKTILLAMLSSNSIYQDVNFLFSMIGGGGREEVQ